MILFDWYFLLFLVNMIKIESCSIDNGFAFIKHNLSNVAFCYLNILIYFQYEYISLNWLVKLQHYTRAPIPCTKKIFPFVEISRLSRLWRHQSRIEVVGKLEGCDVTSLVSSSSSPSSPTGSPVFPGDEIWLSRPALEWMACEPARSFI